MQRLFLPLPAAKIEKTFVLFVQFVVSPFWGGVDSIFCLLASDFFVIFLHFSVLSVHINMKPTH